MTVARSDDPGSGGSDRRSRIVSLGGALDILLGAFGAVAAVLLIVMMLATVLRVVLRAFFNYGILGVDQISGILMVYIAFLGAAWVLRRDGHVTVDIFLTVLSPRARRVLEIVGSMIGAAACLMISYYSFLAVRQSLQRGILVAAELEIPRAVNLVVIPIGCFLLGIEFVRRAARLYRGEMSGRDEPRMEA